MNRNIVWLLSLCAIFSACSKSAPTTPAASAAPLPEPTYTFQSGGESLVAQFHVAIDSATMSAAVSPVRAAAAQPPQAMYYDLDIGNFLEANTFRIVGVSNTAEGDLNIEFAHYHPFREPNFVQPITAANRADLGYTGRLLILAQQQSRSFFAGEVQADPDLVLDPDGFVRPGDLLNTSTTLNNAFPYELLVNETLDPRYSISNGGNPQGNYDPATGGWQRSNIGAQRNGWTGFDFIHGGQGAGGSFLLNGDRVAGGFIFFDVALLIKYTDPRGQGGRDLRFPPEVADPLQFAYRLPFAALDASKVDSTAAIDFGDFAGSARTMHLLVRDWDNTALAGADADLSDETDVSLIQPGGGDQPLVDVDMPDVSAVPYTPSSNAGSGLPGDEIDYTINVFNSLDPGPGDYFACARVNDPENALDRSPYHFGVDPLTVLPTRTPIELVTYQVVPYSVGGALPEINDVLAPSPGLPGTLATFQIDAPGATTYDWSFGLGALPRNATGAAPEVMLDQPGVHYGAVIVSNARGTSAPFTFQYTVLQPASPTIASHEVFLDVLTSPVLVEHAGRPSIFYSVNVPPYQVRAARAGVATPTASDDWVTVMTLPINWDPLEAPFGQGIDALSHQGRLCLANNAGQVCISTVAEPFKSGEWATHTYSTATGTTGISPAMASQGETLAIAYFDKGPAAPSDRNNLGFAFATGLPGATGNWTDEVAYNFAENRPDWFGGGIDLIPYGDQGFATSFWWLQDEGCIAIMGYTEISNPTRFDWSGISVVANTSTDQIMRTAIRADADLRPFVVFERRLEGVFLQWWHDAYPDFSTPTTQVKVLDNSAYSEISDLSLMHLGNRPLLAMTTHNLSTDVVTPFFARAITPGPTGPADFLVEPLPIGTGATSPIDQAVHGDAELINGIPSAVYYDSHDQTLIYATATGPW